MHITLESDYAIRIVACLAKNNARFDAKTISENTNVSLRFALKILGKLVKSEIIVSFKGTSGGYELARNPEDITLKDVIEAIEGTYMLSRCLEDGYCCSRGASGNCAAQDAFEEISNIVVNKLSEYDFKTISKNMNNL